MQSMYEQGEWGSISRGSFQLPPSCYVSYQQKLLGGKSASALEDVYPDNASRITLSLRAFAYVSFKV